MVIRKTALKIQKTTCQTQISQRLPPSPNHSSHLRSFVPHNNTTAITPPNPHTSSTLPTFQPVPQRKSPTPFQPRNPKILSFSRNDFYHPTTTYPTQVKLCPPNDLHHTNNSLPIRIDSNFYPGNPKSLPLSTPLTPTPFISIIAILHLSCSSTWTDYKSSSNSSPKIQTIPSTSIPLPSNTSKPIPTKPLSSSKPSSRNTPTTCLPTITTENSAKTWATAKKR